MILSENIKETFDSDLFCAAYHYNGALGVERDAEHTVFRLWAPTAQQVTLRLYERGDTSACQGTYTLTSGEKGVWSISFPLDLAGFYYDYEVTVDGICRITADPYAVACGLNGQRSMVLDLKSTNPDGWDTDCAPVQSPENIIYEIHVRDFTDSAASGICPEWQGKYLALTQAGATLNDDDIHPTGLDYLKRLGITHVQLMPVYDYGSVDEADSKGCFNWGYDPVNYNIPEGSYSTDPRHGEVRIRELKQMIQALHRNGIRVIMDVVYNHTYSLDSPLFKTVPWYFYRQYEDGTPSNGSGCGNDIASERSMCARYILDSVLYWAQEYHMDGFRFDLMGLLDVPLMSRIRAELDRIYGTGEKLVYGEPWSAGPTAAKSGTVFANKEHLRELPCDVGAFCDATRDAIRGGLQDACLPGMASGGPINARLLQFCLEGWTGTDYRFAAGAPSQTLNYISAHDDWTLLDKLVFTLDPERNFLSPSADVLYSNRLAAVLLFACRGNLFLLSGEEAARTKTGIKNSYNLSIEINRIDWARMWRYSSLADYYRGLIALRKQIPALTRKTYASIPVKQISEHVFQANLKETDPNSRYSELVLFVNAGESPVHLVLPAGCVWSPLFDGNSSFLWQSEAATPAGSEVTLPAVSAAAWGVKRKEG